VENLQENCREIIMTTDKPFRRLDHYKMHEYSRKLSMGKDAMQMSLATSIDGMFRRKRGRPPKNRVIEVSFFLAFRISRSLGCKYFGL
jgi:hypothetical protein